MLVPLDTVRTDRRAEILEKAAQLFGSRGYDRSSMRDIAAAAGLLPGSIYHHFASKEALLVAIHAAAVDQAMATVEQALAGLADPWDRLEAACVAHVRLLLTGGALAAVVADAPEQQEQTRADLVQHRDRYEAVFRRLVADVALPPGVSATAFRHALLGALNWTLTWYRPGGDPPETVARNLFAVFRCTPTAAANPTAASLERRF